MQQFEKIFRKIILTWFGCGLVPKAPGTAGTIGTIPLAWWLLENTSVGCRIAVAFVITVIACAVSGWDQKENPVRDPQFIVIDETAGYLWNTVFFSSALSALPALSSYFAAPSTTYILVLSFITFRIFDIAKPFPGNWFDNRSKDAKSPWFRGACIVLDDVVAGFYGAAIVFGFIYFGV